ncbi:hypothetical protein [Rhodopseudomonas sp.]|uniref:hypothetical protein n=1 Tax=Rhodopseudomonas sp. TaxID=1078 RepID=UPI003B3B9242
MSGYAASNLLGGSQQAISTNFKTLLAVMAAAATSLQRGKIVEVTFGTDGTPADQAMTFDVSRITADGTASAVTPNKLDPADGAFLGAVTANHTAEPTVTANSGVLSFGVNQRATTRWVAFPGQELVYPATANNGFAFRAKSPGYTGTAIVHAIVANP